MNKRDPGVNINVGVVGTVFGWCSRGETEADAAARLVLEIEMQANAKGDPRLHLQIKEEAALVQNHSRLAATLAEAIAAELPVDDGDVGGNMALDLPTESELAVQLIQIIDGVLTQLRQAHEPLNPCPVVLPHPKGPCVFCVAYDMREVLILQDVT